MMRVWKKTLLNTIVNTTLFCHSKICDGLSILLDSLLMIFKFWFYLPLISKIYFGADLFNLVGPEGKLKNQIFWFFNLRWDNGCGVGGCSATVQNVVKSSILPTQNKWPKDIIHFGSKNNSVGCHFDLGGYISKASWLLLWM